MRQRTGIELFPVGYRLTGTTQDRETRGQLLEDEPAASNGFAPAWARHGTGSGPTFRATSPDPVNR